MGVDGLLEECARFTPEKTALVSGGDRRSYRDLDDRANQLAHALIAGGIQPGDRVAICLPGSIDTVAAIFAVLKAGAVFVALNALSRSERLAGLLADCGGAAIVSATSSSRRL